MSTSEKKSRRTFDQAIIMGPCRPQSIAIIGAATLACSTCSNPTRSLELISQLKHIDVNPSLWNQIVAVVSTLPKPAT
jgi:hypothetical protein